MDTTRFTVLLLVWIVALFCSQHCAAKVCKGTHQGISHASVANTTYRELQRRYTNCTYVDGNLEITFLDTQPNYDLSFLSHIKEVTGYVLIVIVYANKIPLTSLRIIRGRELYHSNSNFYSLYVAKNHRANSTSVGLMELQLVSLHEILGGDVFFYNNNLLCFDNTILWDDILTGEGARNIHHHDSTDYRRQCPACHEKCLKINDRHCWGEGPDMCQTLTKIPCSQSCESRCFGDAANECCNSECAGGCTGPSKSECWACKNFDNEGQCVPFCPQEEIYNPEKYKYERNPKAKFTYGTLCVDECPAHLISDSGACVNDCGAERYNKDRTCVDCEGPCPKSCQGTNNDFVHAGNISIFEGCTIVQGSLKILTSTFKGDSYRNLTGLRPEQLKAFESVNTITGHLQIQGGSDDFVDLSFFKNLETIQGTVLDNTGSALNIYKTTLERLSLVNLKKISNGFVLVSRNYKLCYADDIDFRSITSNNKQRIIVGSNNPNCTIQGKVCDAQCSAQGCWGPGPRQCLSCKNFHLDNVCLESCNRSLGMYDAGNQTCKRCHEECEYTCSAEGNDNCDMCKNVMDGPYCVAKCPDEKYPDAKNICQPCHANCVGGCTGPVNNIGAGGCNACAMAVMDRKTGESISCLLEDSECEDGYYQRIRTRKEGGPMVGKVVCVPCHPDCRRCNGYGVHYQQTCQECAHYLEESSCVANCSGLSYPDNAAGKCVRCSKHCSGCRGPTVADCLSCKKLKVYIHLNVKMHDPDEEPKFNCTSECPDNAQHTILDEHGDGDMICVAKAPGLDKATLGAIVGPILAIIFIIAVVMVAYLCHRRAKAVENKLRLTAKMSGYDDESEPLTPTAAKPDMASLRFIKESELRRGNIIGSGAFGTVYKGVWIPEGENVKIPVAIKVLQEGTSPNQNKELLEEARIMASVDSVNCIRLLAVCMTQQMMLITQLMPLGCLLDYVRKHKANIGSKVLLNWCTQVARGMSYMETEKGIVHRDLAARNVLVQSNNQVRITDFGLAKLLDYDEEEFHGTGGKMPIKWLALECIHNRVFTHKSDVWSYGVTIWELFTYGQRPYENVRARDIPDLLAKGERLPQPSICTIDVYMIMIKCWMLDAQSRPNFKELADEFAKMSRDPGRYLVINGDSLLRLPSHSYDSKDIVRNMSNAGDGPEEIVDAEEYLQPQAPVPHRPTQLTSKLEKVPGSMSPPSASASVDNPRPRGRPFVLQSPPVVSASSAASPPRSMQHHNAHSPNSLPSSSSSPSSFSPHHHPSPPRHVREEANYDNDRLIANDGCAANADENGAHPDYPSTCAGAGGPGRREIKYSGLEAAAAARKQREYSPNARDSIKSRYSSDPCKVLGTGAENHAPTIPEESSDQMDGDMPPPQTLPPAPPTPMGGPKEGQLFSKAQRLPVDEDDYLTPKSSNPKAYIDLVDDYLPPSEVGDPQPAQEIDVAPQENYGYMDMSPTHLDNPEYFESTDASQPGINMNKFNAVDSNGIKTEKTPLRMRSMSSDSEGANSERDYYNETDMLNSKKKGLQHPVMYVPPRTESTV